MTSETLTQKRATQVGHSLNMVAEQPRYMDDVRYPIGLRAAAMESFCMNVRAVADFLTATRQQPDKEITRDQFGAGFDLATTDRTLHSRVRAAWDLASKHVAHFSLSRVPDLAAGDVRRFDAAEAGHDG